MEEKRSNVWAHFDLDAEKKKTKCRLCGIMLSYAGSSTSSMRKHLNMKHKSLTVDDTSTNPVKKQGTLTQGFFGYHQKKIDCKSKTYETITRKAMMMCVRDLRPLNIVKGDGFRDFCHALNPNYIVPCPKTLHNHLMKDYAEMKNQLKAILKQSPGVSLTTDMWTSCATHGYITVTGHYINDVWDLKACILATRRVEDRHTGENIADALVSIQNEFEIEHVCGVTTDNASNMTVAARVTGYPHVRCFAHTLQLAVHDGLKLPSIDNVIIHARKLVSYFAKSVIGTQELEDVQKRLGKKVKHVVTDVPTRWNSVYFMFERLNELHASIVAVLHNEKFKKQKHLQLKDNHWLLIEQLVIALKPLVSATEVLCSEEFPTASGVYPLVFALVTKHLISSDLDTRIVSDLKTTIANGLKSRLMTDDYWVSPTMTATALDPCFKNLRFLDEEQRKGTREHVVSLLRVIAGQVQEPPQTPPAVEEVTVKQEPDLETPMKKPKFCETEKAMSFLYGDIIEISDDQNDDMSSRNVEEEYNEFLASAAKVSYLQPGKSFSLSWWKENKHSFPRVATLAQRFLSIPGTSVPSERAFSAAGLTITQQRASLHPDTSDAIIFLNKNMRTSFAKPESSLVKRAAETVSVPVPDETKPQGQVVPPLPPVRGEQGQTPSLPDLTDDMITN